MYNSLVAYYVLSVCRAPPPPCVLSEPSQPPCSVSSIIPIEQVRNLALGKLEQLS